MGVCWRSHFASSSASVNGFSSGGMKVRPCAFITATGGRSRIFKIVLPFAGRAGRIIQRTQKTLFVLQQLHDFLLIPQMVAGGDGVHAVAEKFLGDVGRDAVAAGGIFAVGDDDIEAVRLPQGLGRSSLTARRPGLPTMSPMNRIFTGKI
jgi:hypothetical protein